MSAEGDEAVAVRLLFSTLCGSRKCKLVPINKYEPAAKFGVGLAEVILGFPSYCDHIAPQASLTCAGEVRLFPDSSTLVQLPWYPQHKAAIVNIEELPGVKSKYCPRAALQRVLAYLEEEHSIQLKIGFETEFVLLDPSKKEVVGTNGAYSYPAPVDNTTYASSAPLNDQAEVLDDILKALQKMGIDVEHVHAESAPGQIEVTTGPASPVVAADNLILTREAIAAVAKKHGLLATFIPKYDIGQAGNGCHCNFSLKKDGEVITAGNEQKTLSPCTRDFLAGVYHHLDALTCFIAPSVNSYRRVTPGCWAGAFKAWGVFNKEAPLRVVYPFVEGAGEAYCEVKTFDATANPYLGVAALAVAGIWGLDAKVDLPPPVDVDPEQLADQRQLMPMPRSLQEAINAFEANKDYKKIFSEVIGSEIMSSFIALRKAEAEDIGDLEFGKEVQLLYQCY